MSSTASSQLSYRYDGSFETAIFFAFERDKSDLKLEKLKKALQNIKYLKPNFKKKSNGFRFMCKTTMINKVVKALNANSIGFVLLSSPYSTVFVAATDRNQLFNSKWFAYIGNQTNFFGFQCFFKTLSDFINFNQKYLDGELESIGVTSIFPYRIMYGKTNAHKPQDWPQEILNKSEIEQCNEELKIIQEQQSVHSISKPEILSFEDRLENALNEHHICGELREYFIETAKDIEDKNDPDLNIVKAICDLLDQDAYEVLIEMLNEDQDYEKVSNEFLKEYFN